jgi:hypothetical protein
VNWAVVDLVGSTLQLPTAALWNYGAYLDALLGGRHLPRGA